ncbi:MULTISPECIES: oligoendopeptidase F [Sutcliffiella]|uniref:Oligopeptidase F n=1 Tax=Sutcliffiella cohnii TaxID=33932 RepID=A0A223KSE3_9BACI|nr:MULTISPECIES: oligoendopeptidase F [Sutcliffiella]AST92421.1 oligoendopeptidase F [Sutcliffiella cohnii]MED4017109.1 oligoendopeptidase F [Sutcliffiella cohnii]WBL13655.1 oligoendopeptidase F [Sutcliffiella sp. NC1]
MKYVKSMIPMIMCLVLLFQVPFVSANEWTRDQAEDKYKWDLASIYKDEKEWRKDLKLAEKLANKFAKEEKPIESAKQLQKLLEQYFTINQIFEKAYVYSKLLFDVDMGNPYAMELSNEIEKMTVTIVQQTNWFTNAIQDIDKKSWKSIVTHKDLEEYRYFLEQVYNGKEHALPKESEEVLIEAMPFLHASNEIFTMISKDLQLPNIRVNEQEYTLTPQTYSVYMTSNDRSLRKAAFETYYETLSQYEDSFASILANIIKANNFFAKTKKYNSALQASLESKEIEPKVYEKLIKTVDQHLPLFHRYLKLKQQFLQLDNMELYDLAAPSPIKEEKEISYEEAQQIVLKGLAPLGNDYTNIVEKGLKERWVDVYPNKGKATGAYQLGAFAIHPFILLNYQGLQHDVMTLAHEFGHAAHSYFSNENQPYQDAQYVTFTAEVASTLNEHLLHQQFIENAKTKEEKLLALYKYLEDFRVTLFRQTQFAEFEKAVHEAGQNGEALHADKIKEIYLNIVNKHFGKVMDIDDKIAMEWARVPHFFHSSFYTYQYATSFAASAALAEQLKEENGEAQKRIIDKLLSSGGSKPPIQILKETGVDMSNPKPIKQTMRRFEQLLDEFEQLLTETN